MDEVGDDRTPSHCWRCSFEQLEALYQLNVEAKRYAEAAEDAYTSELTANARLYSLQKKALYGLKRAILGTLVEHECADAVRRHEIDGKEYYCIYVGAFSFHSPVDEWDELPMDAPPSATKTLDSFETDPDTRTEHLSEKEALQRLTDRFETPNNYLPTPFVERGYGSEFAGWSQLPGSLEEGDRVDGRFDRGITNPYDEFLFAVGDTFHTQQGECKIVDRYQAWLTPYLDRSPIMPRTVYDVELDGERRETVRQRRLVDDWLILADSIQDPVPDVDGKQADMAGDAVEQLVEQPIAFDIGDIIELDPEWDDEGPYYCKISGASLSYNLIMCEFDPVGPTEEAPLGLSVEEFADDVVAVHESLPQTE